MLEKLHRETLAHMKEIVSEMGQHLGDLDTYIELDLALHLAIRPLLDVFSK